MTRLRTLVLAIALGLPAAAQEAPTGTTLQARETPWEVNCTPEGDGTTLACTMTKSLVLAEQNQLVARATVAPQGEGYELRLLAPHGLSLPQGLTLAIDGVDFPRAAFTTTLPAGVVAVIALTADHLAALGAGETLTATAVQNNGAAFNFSFGLQGFSASLAKLR